MPAPPGSTQAVLHGKNLDVWLAEAGLAYLRVTGSKLDGDDAQELLDGLAQVGGGIRVQVLADIRSLRSISLAVRKIMASKTAGERISHAAVVVSNPVNRMIGSFFLRLNHPPFEMQLFESEAEARRWLRPEVTPG